jgi:hypothetical protein
MTMTIALPPLFAGPGESQYFVNLSASPGVPDGGSVPDYVSPPEPSPVDELTGQFTTTAGMAPQGKALQTDYLTVNATAWMQRLVKVGTPPPPGI